MVYVDENARAQRKTGDSDPPPSSAGKGPAKRAGRNGASR